MGFRYFLGIRSAEMGFTSLLGHVLIHFSNLNTLKPVLKFPEIRFLKGMIVPSDHATTKKPSKRKND